jgi:predicted nucleotidyltransferase component of viral defense system
MIEQMLKHYTIQNDQDYYDALREVMQEIALAGLYRGDFFKKAAFYGGTALRIFYKLDRFSEDLDFSLLEVDKKFNLKPYFKAIQDEFEALGIDIKITSKEKSVDTAIESAFLKSGTSIHILSLKTDVRLNKPIRIKFEIDTNPPLGFSTEEKLLLQPFSFYVKCFKVEDLYAGKMHALLFRKWKNRVKGRDWYDFEWYVKNGYALNLKHLETRAKESGSIEKNVLLNQNNFIKLLEDKIQTLDIDSAKLDIRRFIKDDRGLEIWSKEYFLDLAGRIVYDTSKNKLPRPKGTR